MRIIVELFILDNAVMNALILLIASSFARCKLRPILTVMLSFLGGGYAMLALKYPIVFANPIVKVAFAFVLAFALKSSNRKSYFFSVMFVLLSAVLLGGIGFFIVFSMGGSFAFGALTGTNTLRIGLYTLLVGLCIPRVIRLLASRKNPDKPMKLRVYSKGEWHSFDALIDTGNMATEPLSGLPVVFLPRDICEGFVYPLPIQSVCGEKMLSCTRAKAAKIGCSDSWYDTDIMICATDQLTNKGYAIVGCDALPIALGGKGHGYGEETCADIAIPVSSSGNTQ